ncbi:hypothetical protein Tco_0275854 [Tanacetum coccineum]
MGATTPNEQATLPIHHHSARDHSIKKEQSATPSVVPPSQESETFVDLSAQASLQIRTTMGSSSTLSAPVDTAATTTTSTKAKLSTDVNPDLAGPSQLEESEESDDSFYDLATLDPSEAKRWYVPRRNITNDSLLDDGFSCCTLVDRVAPFPFFSALCSMDCDQLYTEFNVGAARQICLGLEVRSSAKHKLELKEKLNAKYAAREKEAEAAEVVHLRHQVSSLSGEKSALTAWHVPRPGLKLLHWHLSVIGLLLRFLLCVPLFRISRRKWNSSGNQARSCTNRVGRLEAHVIGCLRHMEREFYPTYLTLLVGRRWLLTHGIQLALLKCLKSLEYQGILGHALGRAVDFGMQEGLEAGHEHGVTGRSLSVVDAYNPKVASADYVNAVKALEDIHFPLVDLLKSKKDAGMDEQLSIPIHHAGDKPAVGETSLSFALMNVHARAEGAKKHIATLRQLMMEIVSAPLSSQTWVGEASISAALLSVEDYAEEDTNEALGSVVSGEQYLSWENVEYYLLVECKFKYNGNNCNEYNYHGNSGCPRGKDNLPRLSIRTNIVRLATPGTSIQTGAVTPNRSIHNICVFTANAVIRFHDMEIMALEATWAIIYLDSIQLENHLHSWFIAGAEVEHSKPGFELQGAKMVETGQNRDFRLRTARVTTPGLHDEGNEGNNDNDYGCFVLTDLKETCLYEFPVRLLGLLALAMAAVCASTAVVRLVISCRMASKVMAGVSDVDVGKEYNTQCGRQGYPITVIQEQERNIEDNSNDGGNMEMDVKIVVEVMDMVIEIEFSEELKELLFDEAGK